MSKSLSNTYTASKGVQIHRVSGVDLDVLKDIQSRGILCPQEDFLAIANALRLNEYYDYDSAGVLSRAYKSSCVEIGAPESQILADILRSYFQPHEGEGAEHIRAEFQWLRETALRKVRMVYHAEGFDKSDPDEPGYETLASIYKNVEGQLLAQERAREASDVPDNVINFSEQSVAA